MRLEHSFEVAVPVARAWEVLLDVELIAPCMPGAALSDFDGEKFTGIVKVKLGPVSLSYRGTGRFVERDEAARKVVITASGQDSRGAGAAAATVTAQLRGSDDGASTSVDVVTDLDVSGRAAQFGRGMIGDVSATLLGQFVACLTTKLGEAPAAVAGPADAGAVPASTGAASASAATAGAASADGATTTGVPAATPTDGTATAAAATAAAPTLAARKAAAAPPAEPVPIDLLAVSGVSGMARRAAPYVGGVIVLGLIVWLLVVLLN